MSASRLSNRPLRPDFGRIRKPLGYQRHYTPELQAVLEAGDIIVIEPFQQHGSKVIVPSSMPQRLPDKIINIATPWGTPVPKLTTTSQPQISKLVNELNMNKGELAEYRLIVIDPDIEVLVSQPAEQRQFVDKTGVRKLNYANTMAYAEDGDWGGVPQIWIHEDRTPIQLTAMSMNMNEDLLFAGVLAIGYKYKIMDYAMNDPDNDARIVTTINVGESQTS